MRRGNKSVIHIGTSGFSYDDWKGPFYPDGLPRKDMLAYYASVFPCVEINSTFYALPSAASFAGMVSRTPPGFRFSIKANQAMTHSGNPPADVFAKFLECTRPLRDSGKLACVLAQYPWSFRNVPENRDRIKELRDRVGECTPLVVEFRRSDWLTQDTFKLLAELHIGYCAVDEPKLGGLVPAVAEVTSEIGYVRFHGRNAAQWWEHEHAHQRYDYLYSEDELRDWVPKVRRMDASADDVYVFFNNHYKGKSVENAKMFARMLDVELPKRPGGQMELKHDS